MTFDSRLLENLLNQAEGPALDFKQEQYLFDNADVGTKAELLKDILALANSWRLATAYILIGVKEIKGRRNEIIRASARELDVQYLLGHSSPMIGDFSNVKTAVTFFDWENNWAILSFLQDADRQLGRDVVISAQNAGGGRFRHGRLRRDRLRYQPPAAALWIALAPK